MDKRDVVLTKAEQHKIFNVARGFTKECEKQGLNVEDTKELTLEVMKATAECLLEDRKKKK